MKVFYSFILILFFVSCSSSSDFKPECETNNTAEITYDNKSESIIYVKCILEASTCSESCDIVYEIPTDSSVTISLLADRRHYLRNQKNSNFSNAQLLTNGTFYDKCENSTFTIF